MLRVLTGLLLLAFVLPMASCKKEMMNYEGMEGVYFAARSGPYYASPESWPYRASTNVEFVTQPASVTELTINVPVMITGPMKDYDRTFVVEINTDSTTAVEKVHYLSFPRTGTIPANSISGTFPITLKRTPDMQEQNFTVGLKLVANEHFGLAFPKWKAIPGLGESNIGKDTAFDATLHTINVSDLMVQPVIWRGSIQAGNREAGIWGAFSRKKILLMCQLMNLTYADFGSDQTMPLILSTLISSELARYLVDQFNAGTPVKEDDGRLMFAGGVPWTSIIGVPYQ